MSQAHCTWEVSLVLPLIPNTHEHTRSYITFNCAVPISCGGYWGYSFLTSLTWSAPACWKSPPLPQLHLCRSVMGWFHVCYIWGSYQMLYVQQLYFLHAHSSSIADLFHQDPPWISFTLFQQPVRYARGPAGRSVPSRAAGGSKSVWWTLRRKANLHSPTTVKTRRRSVHAMCTRAKSDSLSL